MHDFELRPAADRAITTTEWLDSRHSFSFGAHYEPDNTHFGLLLAHNEDVLQPGPSYTTHPHRDTEILTWVMQGWLAHEDSSGNRQRVGPGMIQLLSAGSGVQHAEFSASAVEPVHLVQMWVKPDSEGGDPSYCCRDVNAELADAGLVCLASGASDTPLHLNTPLRLNTPLHLKQPNAALWAARLDSGTSISLPAARYLHVFIARGTVRVAGAPALLAGDALRIFGSDGDRLEVIEPAELLIWQLQASAL